MEDQVYPTGEQNCFLNVFTPGNVYPVQVQMTEGSTAFAGTGASCRIKLAGDGVSQFHCMFTMDDDKLIIQNCDTGGSILVNNLPSDCDTVCQPGDTIQIAGCRIVIETNECSESVVNEMPEIHSVNLADESVFEVINEPDVLTHDAVTQSDPSAQEEEFTISGSDFSEFDNELENENIVEQELQLLRSEIEFLQSELASKDEQLNSLLSGESLSQTGLDGDHFDSNDTQRLVERLEDLLEELQHSDQRVKSLEDLLRLSDEANQAEREERGQVESWLSEIESRVAQKENDMELEIGLLKKQCAVAKNNQAKAEAQVKELLAKSESTAHPNGDSEGDQVLKLEHLLLQQQRLLDAANEDNGNLNKRVEVLEHENAAGDVEALEEKLAQIELDRSRERADIARQRAELESAREQLERAAKDEVVIGDSDCRFAAMRQHLRDIHEEEKLANLEKQQNSLSSRISRLLNRN